MTGKQNQVAHKETNRLLERKTAIMVTCKIEKSVIPFSYSQFTASSILKKDNSRNALCGTELPKQATGNQGTHIIPPNRTRRRAKATLHGEKGRDSPFSHRAQPQQRFVLVGRTPISRGELQDPKKPQKTRVIRRVEFAFFC